VTRLRLARLSRAILFPYTTLFRSVFDSRRSPALRDDNLMVWDATRTVGLPTLSGLAETHFNITHLSIDRSAVRACMAPGAPGRDEEKRNGQEHTTSRWTMCSVTPLSLVR